MTPVYEASTVVQINRPLNSDGPFDTGANAATEVEILRTRALVSRVVTSLHLDLVVEPMSLPLISGLLARSKLQLPDFMGAGGPASTADRAQVRQLDVPASLLGQHFVLTSGLGKTFSLTLREKGITIRGKIGELSSTQTRYGVIDVLVTDIQAGPGTQFVLIRERHLAVVERVRRALNVAEQGKASKIIGITLKGSNPEQISRILDRLGQEYLAQYFAQRDAAAAQALAIHDRQLSESARRLKAIDERIARTTRLLGGMDLDSETASLLQRSTQLQARVLEAEARGTELATGFLDQHPAMVVARAQIANLRADLGRVEARSRAVASARADIARLSADRLTEQQLSTELLVSRNKLIMSRSSSGPEVRILDAAETPIHAITLPFAVMAALGCLAGLLAGVAAALLKQGLEARNSRVRTLHLEDLPGPGGSFVREPATR